MIKHVDAAELRVLVAGVLAVAADAVLVNHLAAKYIRQVPVFCSSFAAALAYVSTVVTPPAPAAQTLGVGLRRPCRGQTFSRERATRQVRSGAE
jgi:hypothetical protein